jgi:hypothetical protein
MVKLVRVIGERSMRLKRFFRPFNYPFILGHYLILDSRLL